MMGCKAGATPPIGTVWCHRGTAVCDVRPMVQRRAYGGCLGSQKRGRTRQAAIFHGERHMRYDPWVSEWGNPSGCDARASRPRGREANPGN